VLVVRVVSYVVRVVLCSLSAVVVAPGAPTAGAHGRASCDQLGRRWAQRAHRRQVRRRAQHRGKSHRSLWTPETRRSCVRR
jgi:hypothetical protein